MLFDVHKYRYRRIGEFLKELHLTEGRATGVPTIIKALEKNQSPPPVFETDNERSYFKTTFRIHPEFVGLRTEAATEQGEGYNGTKLAPGYEICSAQGLYSADFELELRTV